MSELDSFLEKQANERSLLSDEEDEVDVDDINDIDDDTPPEDTED